MCSRSRIWGVKTPNPQLPLVSQYCRFYLLIVTDPGDWHILVEIRHSSPCVSCLNPLTKFQWFTAWNETRRSQLLTAHVLLKRTLNTTISVTQSIMIWCSSVEIRWNISWPVNELAPVQPSGTLNAAQSITQLSMIQPLAVFCMFDVHQWLSGGELCIFQVEVAIFLSY